MSKIRNLASLLGMIALATTASAGPSVTKEDGARALAAEEGARPTSSRIPDEEEMTPLGCEIDFLNTFWTFYRNELGAIQAVWPPVAGMGPTIKFKLQPTGGGSITVPSADQFALLDILQTNLDPLPPGYALTPGQPWKLLAEITINGQKCVDQLVLYPLPPPTTVSVAQGPTTPESQTSLVFNFHLTFPLIVPNTNPFSITNPKQCLTLPLPPPNDVICVGGNATPGVDYLGLGGSPWYWSSITFPAHDQDESVPITVIDDMCPENAETVALTWVYASDLSLATDPMTAMLLGAPTHTHTILDNDQGKPPCAVTLPPDSK